MNECNNKQINISCLQYVTRPHTPTEREREREREREKERERTNRHAYRKTDTKIDTLTD